MHIDREDMLELTRRMTIARNCFNRVAGAYMDEEGFIDGSFNTHFLKLSPADKEKQLAIAKTIPYAKTNEQLKNFRIDSRQKYLASADGIEGLRTEKRCTVVFIV